MYSRDRCYWSSRLDEILQAEFRILNGSCRCGVVQENDVRNGVPIRGANAGAACAHFTATSFGKIIGKTDNSHFDMKMVDTGLINVLIWMYYILVGTRKSL